MKKTITTLAVAGAATAASADMLSDLSISGTFDFETQYVYRAAKLASQSFQPSVEFGYPVIGGDLYAGVWTNQPIDNADTPFTAANPNFNFVDPVTGTLIGPVVGKAQAAQANEIDFYAGYAYPVTDIFTVDVGATYYWYPEAGGGAGSINHTTEVYVGVSADVLLSPALYYYYDFDLKQSLIEVSIGYSLDLGEYLGAEGVSIDTGAYLGILDTGDTSGGASNPPPPGVPPTFGPLNPAFPSSFSNGYTYGGVTADLVYAFNDNVSASVGVRWSINNDGDDGTPFAAPAVPNGPGFFQPGLGPANAAGSESQIWFGATIGFAY